MSRWHFAAKNCNLALVNKDIMILFVQIWTFYLVDKKRKMNGKYSDKYPTSIRKISKYDCVPINHKAIKLLNNLQKDRNT